MKFKLFLCFILIYSSSNCQEKSDLDVINRTSEKIIESIRTKDEKSFSNLIGVELRQIGKDKRILGSDFKDLINLYSNYVKSDKAEIVITNEMNELGSLKVVIPFYKGYDSVKRIRLVQLELYYGPKRFVPLDKIARYNIVVDQDIDTILVAPPKQQ